MLLLTWRNLLARKVRLLMSTLAIVLGIGFLAGVMTFSTGLNSTFDNIVEGSTPDAQVRPAGDVQGANAGVGTTALITPADVEKLAALPEVADAAGPTGSMASRSTRLARSMLWTRGRSMPWRPRTPTMPTSRKTRST